jgi:alpha-galactosidase
MTDLVHLSAAGVSVVLDCRGDALPAIVHWGEALGDLTEAQLQDLATAAAPQPIGFSVDGPVRVSLLPEQSAGWQGHPGLAGHRDGRAWSSAFALAGVERTDDGVVVTAADEAAALRLRIELGLDPSGLLRCRAHLTSIAAGCYFLDHLTLFLPVPEQTAELLDFTGHHLRERSPQRTAFTHGLRVRENRTGRTGYDTAHVLCAGTTGFGNRHGRVWGVHTAFSGGARTVAERTYHGW